MDNNCDGQTDEELGTLSCGVGACAQTVDACVNGVPQVCTPGSPSAEICGDGIDQNCDGQDVDCITLAITQIDALIADVKSLGLDKGMEKSLLAKLNAAKSSLEKGNTKAAEGQLNAFINEVNAQRGKKISEADADELITDAQAIIDIIP